MTSYCTGDTIRLTAVFSTFAGAVADLAVPPTVTIYAADQTTVIGTPAAATKSATGTYYYDVILPSTQGVYYYQFSGMSESEPIIIRAPISVVFSP